MRRVAITGMGVVTPVGVGLDATWKALLEGRSGIGPITAFDTTDFGTTIAGEAREFVATDFMEARDVRRSDRFTQFALATAEMAVQQAGWASGLPYVADRIGTIIGSGIGGLATLSDALMTLRDRGPAKMSPFTVPLLMINAGSGAVALRYGLAGVNWAPVSACATGAHALGEAARLIRYGVLDAALAGGAEATVVPLAMGAFAAMGALSRRNHDPEHASRPFDANRDGFVMGEGAGVLALEEMDLALARGATILGEIAGYGATCDAFHMTQPDPDGAGAVAAMVGALADAGVDPSDVGYINAHGTSTPFNDRTEAVAIRKVFGSSPPISSTKSMTGHLLGAAGAVEAAICAHALTTGMLPPNTNYETPDPDMGELDVIANAPRAHSAGVALSNSFGFGGHNASLVIRKAVV